MPNVAGQNGRQGGGVQFDLQGGGENTFTLGGGGTHPVPPVKITQLSAEAQDRTADMPIGTATLIAYTAPPPQPCIITITTEPYSGMAAVIKKWGTGDTTAQVRELEWQRGVGGNKTKIMQFQEVARALQ